MAPRILLVEDDPVSREVIASLLASRGYETDTADDGFGALRLAQETNYELVFIDYHLPEMDGYALARLMRSLGEKTNSTMKMVAITADQFGLAARRGVDTIFDRVLAKPIEPDALFAFVEEFLGASASLGELESFLASDDGIQDPPSPGLALWRARGLDRLPTAAVYPEPTRSELENIETCFRVVDAEAADCLILLRPAGLPAVAAARRDGKTFLQPLFVLDAGLSPMADVLFEPGTAASWTKAAEVLAGFASRRRQLKGNIPQVTDIDMRCAAFLFVADRPLELFRGPTGEIIAPYSAGFPLSDLIGAVKRLATRGLTATKLDESTTDGNRRLIVTLTGRGIKELVASAADRALSIA